MAEEKMELDEDRLEFGFSESELIRVLKQAKATGAGGKTSGALTTAEIAEALELSIDKARAVIRSAIDEGHVVPDRIYRRNITGVVTKIPAYRMVQE